MRKYTRNTIKVIATLAILTTTNINAFSLFGSSQSPKECIIKYEGRLNFLTELYEQNMLVSTGEQIRSALSSMNSQSNAKIYVDARSQMMQTLINRVRKHNTITHKELGLLIQDYKIKQQECIPSNKKSHSSSLVGGW